MTVRCATCLRAERWTGADRAVEVAGGRRRPAEHPELAAWRVLRGALEGRTGPVVAACAGCGQPMVAGGSGPAAIRWTLALPDGEVVVGDGLALDGAPATPDEVEARLVAAYGERVEPARAAFSAVALTAMAVPFALWGVALFVVLWFLYNVLRGNLGF